MKVYLIGYMASGKSRLGKELSEITGYPHIDLDMIFEERYRISVDDFFAKYDESSFRRLEQELLLETASMPNAVVSTGGGTPCFYKNMDFIKKNGVSIYLRVNSRILADRLEKVKKKRPLLKKVEPGDVEAMVRKHLEDREPFYFQATHVVDFHKIDPEYIMKLIPELPRVS